MAENKKKVLIIEDEKPMARALVLKLERAGFAATALHDGEAGVAAIEKDKPDVVVLDLVMPKIDGFGVLSALKDKGIAVPVIVASNLSQEEDAKKAKELGAADYFIKSNTSIADIVERVKKVLGA